MSLTLHTIKPAPKSKKSRKRVGRGNASQGTYSGRGIKGQRARSGGKKGLKMLGLKQFLLHIPKKRGFRSIHAKPKTITTAKLEANFSANEHVDLKTLRKKGLLKDGENAKIVLNGEISKPLVISGCGISKGAVKAVTAAGGKIVR